MRKEVIAVDLGGTYLRIALVKNNKVIRYIKKKTPKEKNALMRELFHSISDLMGKNTKGIGIACAGPLEKGIIKNPPNLPFKNFNLKKALEKKISKRVEIENDANCVAIAEAELGCKKKNFIVLTFGTGIGGGIIINGKLYRGQGYAGELGHIILDSGRDFEDLWRIHRTLSKKYFGRMLLIKDLIKINNKKSKKILNKITQYLGQGISSLIDIFDPEIVVLSGGIKEVGPKFLKMIQKQTQKYTFIPKKTKIQWTKLKHPGILGASLLIN